METMTAIIKMKEPQHVSLELVDEETGVIRKKITLKNFIKVLMDSSEQEGAGVLLGELPKGYYNALIREDGFTVVVSVPAGKFPFQYFDKVYLIPFPRLVFKFVCDEGKVVAGECYAAKDDILTQKTELYHYPFANVHPNGRICFGANQLPKCLKLSDVDALVSMFYGTSSNNDLWRSEYVAGKYPALRVLLEELNGEDTFPLDFLLSHSKTVAQLF